MTEQQTREVPADVPVPDPDSDELTYKFRSTGRGGYHPEYTILRGINDAWPVPIGIVRRLWEGDWSSSAGWEAEIKGGAWKVRGDSRKDAVRKLEQRIVPQEYWDRKHAEYEAAEEERRRAQEAKRQADEDRVRAALPVLEGLGLYETAAELLDLVKGGGSLSSRLLSAEQTLEVLERVRERA
jgi:hypothetical protein